MSAPAELMAALEGAPRRRGTQSALSFDTNGRTMMGWHRQAPEPCATLRVPIAFGGNCGPVPRNSGGAAGHVEAAGPDAILVASQLRHSRVH